MYEEELVEDVWKSLMDDVDDINQGKKKLEDTNFGQLGGTQEMIDDYINKYPDRVESKIEYKCHQYAIS